MKFPKGIMDAGRAFRSTIKQAGPAKATAAAVASGSPAAKSTLMRAKDSRMASYVAKHPYKAAGMGAVGMGAVNMVRGRRGPGTSKVQGRPTGMYKY